MRSSLVLATLLCATAARAQMNVDFDKVEIKVQKVAGSVAMLEGAGGNIGVSTGDDGVIVIDDQFAPLTQKIKAAIATLSKQPVKFVLNTHWHGDHTGGNEHFGEAGAIIIAHDNVRKRLSTEQFMALMNAKVPPSPYKALPIVTFNDEVTFHANGDEAEVFHVKNAHTDGDAIVWFHKANVVHCGDTFMSNGYPLVDESSGGDFEGFIAASERVLAATNGQTRFIPGHGPLADRARYQKWHDMLVGLRGKIKKLVGEGKSLDQIKAAHPTAEWDADWGKGFVKADWVVKFVYDSVTAKK